MYNEEIKNLIEAIPNGQMIRVMYESKLPVKAAFKKQGIEVTKVTETTFRTGVDYDNMASTKEFIESKENYEKQQRDYYTWIIENKIRYHEGKDKYYLHVATVPEHSNTKTSYILTINGESTFGVEKNTIEEFIQNSYWNRCGNQGASVRDISFDNILMIGNITFEGDSIIINDAK